MSIKDIADALFDVHGAYFEYIKTGTKYPVVVRYLIVMGFRLSNAVTYVVLATLSLFIRFALWFAALYWATWLICFAAGAIDSVLARGVATWTSVCLAAAAATVMFIAGEME